MKSKFYAKKICRGGTALCGFGSGQSAGVYPAAASFPNIKTFIRQAERDGGIFAGVFENGQIVGMGGIVRKSDREAEVCKLHVRKEFKGRGYGEKLLNYLERMARRKGFEKLRLHVTTSQRPAINLYRKQAFLPTGNEVYMTEIEGKAYEYDTLYMEKLIV